MRAIGVILASGSGKRFESAIAKQFVKINGKATLAYSLEEFQKSRLFERIILVLPSFDKKYLADKYGVEFVIGGSTRTESVNNALIYCYKYSPDKILFHESARPLIRAEDLKQYLDALDLYNCAITSSPIVDALYGGDRDQFKLLQAPEAYRFNELFSCYNSQRSTVSIYEQLPNPKIKFITLNHPNYKLTTPVDLFMIEQLVKFCPYQHHEVSLAGRRVLLIGSTGGIGSAVKKLITDQYADFEVLYTPSHDELNLKSDTLDVQLLEHFPDVDLVINCAGVGDKDGENILTTYEEHMKVNFRANAQIVEYAKKVVARNNKTFNIVFLSSSSATKGRQYFTMYSASKAALQSLVESQSALLSKSNIFLNCICPEKVNTAMSTKLHGVIDVEELLTPEEVASVVLNYSTCTSFGQIYHLRKGQNLKKL